MGHNSDKNAYRVISLDSIGCSFESEHKLYSKFQVYMNHHAKRDLIGTPRQNNKNGNEASTG